jgi:hypothetical protein
VRKLQESIGVKIQACSTHGWDWFKYHISKISKWRRARVQMLLSSCIMPCQMCHLCLRWNVCGMHGVCSWQPSESEQVTTSPGNTWLNWDFELSSVPVLNLYHCQDWEGTWNTWATLWIRGLDWP